MTGPRYRIELAEPAAHRYRVLLTLANPAAEQDFSLPAWIPGSYMVREFAKHLSRLEARQGGRDLPVEQLDKASWRLRCQGRAALTLSYEVYAFDASVRTAWLDERRAFFNPSSLCLRAHGREDERHRIELARLPGGWQVATEMAAADGGFEAAGYDELLDHPFEIGAYWQGEFVAAGVPHRIVVAGGWPSFDGERLLADVRSICEAQIAFWDDANKAPFERYSFLLWAVDDGHGGLEHRASTALICARRELPTAAEPAVPGDPYARLLGLFSHEYFHAWNVKRLRPAEFARFDYQRENHTELLWFFEGFTSYYDDQFLLRTGLIDAATYLKLLGKTVNQVLATPGRLSYSVAQASFDAWTRYYRPDENTANATVSYYTKGSLVALALDLALRELPASNKAHPSLDGVMQRLWQLGRPIQHRDVAQALADEAGQPPLISASKPETPLVDAWQAVLDRWTETCEELPLQALLDKLGIAWNSKAAPLPQQWGLRIQEAGGGAKVQAIMRGSLAEQIGLSVGDELLALDGWRVKKAEDLIAWHDAAQAQALVVSRDQRVLTLTVPALASGATNKPRKQTKGQATPAPASELIALTLADVAQAPDKLARRQAWLQA